MNAILPQYSDGNGLALPRSFCLTLLELSAQLCEQYQDDRLEQAIIQCASELVAQTLDKPRVAIFGGSFNPATIGHVDFIRVLLEQFSKVHVIPSGQSPLKTATEYAAPQDRLQMLDLALNAQLSSTERARLGIETLEIDAQAPSWMIMTLSALTLMHHGEESYTLACGYDHILSLPSWYRWRDLGKLCELYFYPREGMDICDEQMIKACHVLCDAGLKCTIFFTEASHYYSFAKSFNLQSIAQPRLILQHAPRIKIRASAASNVRAFYHACHSNLICPPGISPEVHQYILTHQLYRDDGRKKC